MMYMIMMYMIMITFFGDAELRCGLGTITGCVGLQIRRMTTHTLARCMLDSSRTVVDQPGHFPFDYIIKFYSC